MARTPSKITKRDIDKNLYLEIVSEANSKTNIQKLLDDYVRKDESIGEWQLPDAYRSALTKRINNMDADIEVLKDAKNQKAINDNIEKRLEIVEKAQGIKKDEEEDVSPAAGTQIAANTANIAKHEKQISMMDTRLQNVESSANSVKYQYQNEDNKVREDLGAQISATTKRLDDFETTLSTKRGRDELITEDDLDESVKGNIKKILDINSETFEALGNMDAVVKRIDMIDAKTEGNKKAIDEEDTKLATVKSELLQNTLDKSNETNKYITNVEKSVQSSIGAIRSDMAASSMSINNRFSSVDDKDDEQDTRIKANEDAIGNVTESVNNNAIKIRSNADSILDIEDRLNDHDSSISQNAQAIKTLSEKEGKCFGIEKGKLLTVGDDDGTVVGKGIFVRAYITDNDDTTKEFFQSSVSPILDIRTGMLYTIKTAEEIAADTKTAADAAAEGSENKDASESDGSGTGDELEEPSDEEKQLILRYKQTPKYTSYPECKNTFILDAETNMIFAVIDSDGVVVSFTTRRGVSKSREVKIEAGNYMEYARNDASMSQPVTVYVRDDDESSKSYGKWLNSEGVATVAYTTSAYTVYNNGNEAHTFRILED